jgi:hypothetical protein
MQADTLLNCSTDFIDQARLVASCSSESGDWLNALPLACAGLKMDNATFRIAAGLRLDAPIVRPHVCIYSKMITVDVIHGRSCRHGSGRRSHPNQVSDLLCRSSSAQVHLRDVSLTHFALEMESSVMVLLRYREGKVDASLGMLPALIHSLNHTYKHAAVLQIQQRR